MVLAWVSERLAVAMRQAEDRDNVLDKPTLIDLEARWGDKGQANAAWTTKWDGHESVCDSLSRDNIRNHGGRSEEVSPPRDRS